MKVFPLIWGDFAVGALVVGSAQERNIALGTFDMVSVIGDHAATAIANAQMYERMEMLATTDGLTAMTNHRTFQERFDELIKVKSSPKPSKSMSSHKCYSSVMSILQKLHRKSLLKVSE